MKRREIIKAFSTLAAALSIPVASNADELFVNEKKKRKSDVEKLTKSNEEYPVIDTSEFSLASHGPELVFLNGVAGEKIFAGALCSIKSDGKFYLSEPNETGEVTGLAYQNTYKGRPMSLAIGYSKGGYEQIIPGNKYYLHPVEEGKITSIKPKGYEPVGIGYTDRIILFRL